MIILRQKPHIIASWSTYYVVYDQGRNLRGKQKRSGMLRKINLIIMIALLIGLNASFSTAFGLFSGGAVISLTNTQRAQNGLGALSTNQALTNAATAKANDMFAKGYFAHNSPDGKTPWDFIHEAGYNYVYAGENLAIGYADASELMSAWMNSSSHRDNIVSPNFQDIGVAVVAGQYNGVDTIIVAQEFGALAQAQTQPAGNSAPENSNTTSQATATPQTVAPAFSILTEKSKVNPTSVFAGEEVEFIVTVSGQVQTLEVQADGLKVNMFGSQNVTTSGNEKTYSIKQSIAQSGNYKLSVVATDSSKNQKTAEIGTLEVKPTVIAGESSAESKSLFAGFSSPASIAGMIVFIGAILTVIVYIIIRRTKFQKMIKTGLATWEF